MSTLDENLPVRNIEEVVCSFGGTLKQERQEEEEGEETRKGNLPGKIAFHGSGNAHGLIPGTTTPPVGGSVEPIEIRSLDEDRSFPRRDIVKIAGVGCDFCRKFDHQGTVELHKFEKILALIALKKLGPLLGIDQKKVNAGYNVRRLCKPCFDNLYLFRDRVKSFLEKRRPGKRPAMEGNDHGYQCRCPSCQNKYGDLPVLLKGIEEQHKIESSEQVIDQSTARQPYQAYASFDVVNPPMVNDYSTPTMHQTPVKYEKEIKTEPCEAHPSYQKQLPYYNPIQDAFLTHQNYPASNVDYSTPLKTDPFPSTSMQPCASEINDFDINLFDAPDGFEHANADKAPLPTMLTDLENQTMSFDQPSTSMGFSGHGHSIDDKLPRRTMTCAHCGKKFTHKGDFNKHLRKHTKEKPYKCSFCQKPFSHTSNLHRHERIHSGDRPYKCEFCDKCFNRTDKLESHKNSKFCKNRRRYK